MKRYLLYIICLAFLFSACKKDKLPEIPDSNTPVFLATGEINGTPFEFIAGENLTQMTEDIKMINGVNYFSAHLGNEQEKVMLTMADGDLDLIVKNWNFENVSSIDLLTDFEVPLFSMGVFDFYNSQMITNIDWEVNGNPVNGEKIDFIEPGRYDVCGNFSFLGGTYATVCNELIIGFNRTTEAQLIAEPVQNASFRLELDLDEGDLSGAKWFVNDSLFSTDLAPYFTAVDEHNIIRCEYITSNGGKRAKSIYLNRDNSEVYVQDFGYFERNSQEFADYLLTIDFELAQGKFRAFPYEDSTSVDLDEVTLYEETDDKKIYLAKGSYSGKFTNLDTEEIVDGEINFKFAIPMNK